MERKFYAAEKSLQNVIPLLKAHGIKKGNSIF